jgi:coenzyme PQQ precursor peptide PqqA
MKQRWTKPTFEHVPLGAEVTAYLGTATPLE